MTIESRNEEGKMLARIQAACVKAELAGHLGAAQRLSEMLSDELPQSISIAWQPPRLQRIAD